MTITTTTVEPGIVSVTVDYPKVNAIPSRGWFELADAVTRAGEDPETHVVILSEMVQHARVIRIGSKHVPGAIRPMFGDAIG